MPRFFTESIIGTAANLTGEDARHITRSLRCRVGEELTLCDGQGSDYRCRIATLDGDQVSLTVLEQAPTAAEPPVQIILYQALPKGDKLELIVQKAVELGVSRIVLVLTSRCVSRPDAKSMGAKLERLNRIALEAAKQSGRGIIPRVEGLLSLSQAAEELCKTDCPILFYENAVHPLGTVLAPSYRTIGVLVGCEGGFSAQEAEELAVVGVNVCTMGPRILRCETAPLYALAAITYHYENKRG